MTYSGEPNLREFVHKGPTYKGGGVWGGMRDSAIIQDSHGRAVAAPRSEGMGGAGAGIQEERESAQRLPGEEEGPIGPRDTEWSECLISALSPPCSLGPRRQARTGQPPGPEQGGAGCRPALEGKWKVPGTVGNFSDKQGPQV